VAVARGRWDRIGWQAEPVMKKIGPTYGRNGPVVKGLIEQADAAWLKGEFDAGREVVLTDAAGNSYTITGAEVTFAEHLPENVFTAPMQDATVYVDVTLSPELEGEGYGREVTRRLQEMRRQAGLKVEDLITAEVAIADQQVVDLVQPWIGRISDDVRATSLTIHAGSLAEQTWQASQTWEVEEVTMTMGLSKAED
jgi:isoleucyl-tRNA synthetase